MATRTARVSDRGSSQQFLFGRLQLGLEQVGAAFDHGQGTEVIEPPEAPMVIIASLEFPSAEAVGVAEPWEAVSGLRPYCTTPGVWIRATRLVPGGEPERDSSIRFTSGEVSENFPTIVATTDYPAETMKALGNGQL